jgi:acylaminoacyl-peptidase
VIASPSQDVSPEVVASTISPSGKLTAVLRETNSAGDKKRFVEIWDGERLEASVNVTKAHDVFYTDGEVHSSPSPISLPHQAHKYV